MKRYSDSFKNRVCEEYQRGGVTQAELWEKYGVSVSSISKWLARHRQGDSKKFVRRAQKNRRER